MVTVISHIMLTFVALLLYISINVLVAHFPCISSFNQVKCVQQHSEMDLTIILYHRSYVSVVSDMSDTEQTKDS